MRIAAFDLGLKGAVAVGDVGGGPPIVTAFDMRVRRGEGAGMRYLRWRRMLPDMLDGVDVVVYETVARHLGTEAAHVWGALHGLLLAACESKGITAYEGVPVGTIKRHATGKGNADKAAMIEAAERKWGDLNGRGERPWFTDDEADALWLLDLVISMRPRGDGGSGDDRRRV